MSKDLNEQFRNHLINSNEPLDIDFSIQVLSSGSWPFQQSFTFSLPTEVHINNDQTEFTIQFSLCLIVIFIIFSWSEVSLVLPLSIVVNIVVES